MFSGSSSIKSSQGERASSHDGGFQETGSDDETLRENLLEDGADQFSLDDSISSRTLVSIPQRSAPAYGDASDVRLIIAIQYGTTFTSVAMVRTDFPEKTEILLDWGPKMDNQLAIPSVYSYSPSVEGERQWAMDLSENAVITSNTKLELEAQDTQLDELELIFQVLGGTGNLAWEHVKKSDAEPQYMWKTPTGIITDYLTKVRECIWKSLDLGFSINSKIPIDIAITIPTNWPYEATNSIFKAFRQAGFNEQTFPNLDDMILVTEAEAAAVYTAHHLNERKIEFVKASGWTTLSAKNEIFVLCDAGGGTVDAIAYQVTHIEPHLEIMQVSNATSDKCGAAFVDANFKRWLKKIIGRKCYSELDPNDPDQQAGSRVIETGEMRQLMRAFDIEKKRFSNKSEKIRLDLPGVLDRLNIDGRVTDGELKIHPDEMKAIFNPCVNRVVALINGQRQQVESKNNREVKNVFLVGGFGESPYLQEELRKSLMRKRVTMRKLERDQSLTAVVRGAAIYGVEKRRHEKLRLMRTSKKSYGIEINKPFLTHNLNSQDGYTDSRTNMAKARKQFVWLIHKDDLVLSDENRVAENEFTHSFRADDDAHKFNLPIYTYLVEDDNVPERSQPAQHDVAQIGLVKCDLSKIPTENFASHENRNTGEKHWIAHLTCIMEFSLTRLNVEVYVDQTRVGHTQLMLLDEAGRRDSVDSWALHHL